MSKSRAKKHLHRYEKVKLGKSYIVFKCNLPDCSHYIRKELAKGKMCECNRCGEPMILDAAAMDLKRPHCQNCVVRKDKDVLDAIKDFFGTDNPPSTS